MGDKDVYIPPKAQGSCPSQQAPLLPLTPTTAMPHTAHLIYATTPGQGADAPHIGSPATAALEGPAPGREGGVRRSQLPCLWWLPEAVRGRLGSLPHYSPSLGRGARFFPFYQSPESLRKGCWDSLKGEEGTRGEMIGSRRSLGTRKRGVSLRHRERCPACCECLGGGARRVQSPDSTRAPGTKQVFSNPVHRSNQQRLAGCVGWRTHEKRWVASLGSGRPSRR